MQGVVRQVGDLPSLTRSLLALLLLAFRLLRSPCSNSHTTCCVLCKPALEALPSACNLTSAPDQASGLRQERSV
jgi:hypothetical protein